MKVVHIVTRDLGTRYGAAANIFGWMDWERRNGFDVVLVAGGTSPATDDPGIRVRLVDSLVRDVEPLNDYRALRAIRAILEEERPDLVHTHHSKAGILGRLAVPRSTVEWPHRDRHHRRPGTRILHTVHMASFGPAYGRSSGVFLALERLCARRTTEFVAVGEELRSRYLTAGVGREGHFRVVRSPAGVERFLATRGWSPARRRAVREEWQLPADGRIVAAAGLLEERKRHGLLIERLAPLLAEGGTTLVIAGDGPLHEQLRAQIEAAGLSSVVRLVGYTDRLEEIVAASDVFAHTARVEGVPQTVLQALAAGIPVVATAVEGLHEVPSDPVRVVDVEGVGLPAAVRRILDGDVPPPADADGFEPWTVAAVERQRTDLYRDLMLLGDTRSPADVG